MFAAGLKTCGGLSEFEEDANADLAAATAQEMVGCVSAYEAAKAQAGALDFLDLLLKTRDLIRDDAEARQAFSSASGEYLWTSSRIPIRCRLKSCCFWLRMIRL